MVACGQPSAVRARRAAVSGAMPMRRDSRIALVSAGRARHQRARHGTGDEKADGARFARHIVFAAAMDRAGRKHQFMPHQHDAAG